MGKSVLIAIASCLLLTACVSSVRPAAEEWQGLHDIFRYADIIPDDRLDRGEFDMYHQAMFSLLDFNQDGSLTRKECMGDCSVDISQYRWKKEEWQRAALYRHFEFTDTPYRFDTMDADHSGTLSVYEYILFGRERFSYFDQNNDGVIREAEFCAGYRSSMACDVKEAPFDLLKGKIAKP